MVFSRWSDDTGKQMEEIIENMLNFSEWCTPYNDPFTGDTLSFYNEKVFDETQTINLNNTEIRYNMIKFEFEKPRSGEERNEMRSARIANNNGFIVIFTDGYTTQLIVNKSNNDATKTILRKINNYRGQGEIKSNSYNITEDFFIWMISKVLNNESDSIDENSHLVIRKIVGFKGSTDNQLAEVIGSGNRIMNALSTLAFLFENEGVSYVKPILEYRDHTIELFLKLNGSIDINFENYTGSYFMELPDSLKAKVILMVSLEVIPKIIASYGDDVSENNWSLDKKIDLILEIGRNIQAKVEEKVVLLRDSNN